MFVIVTYDISAKRVSKVMKVCRKYLTHVQSDEKYKAYKYT
jgi:CRISPR-associated protein Cas2